MLEVVTVNPPPLALGGAVTARCRRLETVEGLILLQKYSPTDEENHRALVMTHVDHCCCRLNVKAEEEEEEDGVDFHGCLVLVPN